jgi:membrane associated rhomboid family serine protease
LGAALMPNLVLSMMNLSKGFVWTLLTSAFVHADWTHLLVNMLGVFVFGRVVEQELGITKTFFVYFGSLFISMLFAITGYFFILQKNVIIIGASGALMGLISAGMLLAPFRITMEMFLPIPLMVKGWAFFYFDLQGLLQKEKDGVSHLAHILGFLAISILVYFFGKKEQKRFSTGLWINIISFIVFLIAVYFYRRYFPA